MNDLNTSLSPITVHKSTRDGFGEELVELGKKDEKIVVLCADVTESTRTHLFKQAFPERFFECGVAEQNMMGIAAGLALSGKIPFVVSYGVFNPGRNWEQLRLAVCYSQANVKIVGGHAGISTGADGASHQALEDLALTRVLPNLTVLSPCDFWETKKATSAAAAFPGPVYLRLFREKTAVLTQADSPFTIGQAQVMKQGKDLTMIACGPAVYETLIAAQKLSQTEKIEGEVINCATIKPLDKITLLTSAKKTGKVVTVEEHQVLGGLGGAVAELLSEELPTPLLRLGMPNCFGESGSAKELLKKYGLDAEGIVRRIKEII